MLQWGKSFGGVGDESVTALAESYRAQADLYVHSHDHFHAIGQSEAGSAVCADCSAPVGPVVCPSQCPTQLSAGDGGVSGWFGSFSEDLDWRVHTPAEHPAHLNCARDVGAYNPWIASYITPSFSTQSHQDAAQAICKNTAYNLTGEYLEHCLLDVAASGDTQYATPWIAANAENVYESNTRYQRADAGKVGLVPQEYAYDACTGFVESTITFDPPRADEPVRIIIKLTLCTTLLLGEVITVKLPGFTGATTLSGPCVVGDLSCTNPLTESLLLEGNDGKSFIGQWDEAAETASFTYAAGRHGSFKPLEITIEPYINSPVTGVTTLSTENFKLAIDFNSPSRYAQIGTPQEQHDAPWIRPYAVQTMGTFKGISVSYTNVSPMAGEATELRFAFTLNTPININETVVLTLPGFTAQLQTGISPALGSTEGFTIEWGASSLTYESQISHARGRDSVERARDESLGRGHSLIFTRIGNTSLPAETNVLFIVPLEMGITLPLGGVCDRWATDSMLVATTTIPPIASASAASYGGIIEATQDCPRPNAELIVPGEVMKGSDIIVKWRSGGDLRPRMSHNNDWIGLFRYGECEEPGPLSEGQTPGDTSSLAEQEAARGSFQNTCFLRSVPIPMGRTEGEIRFEYEHYQYGLAQGGKYEARLFAGESPGGSGRYCRGLRSLANTPQAGAYVQCSLESISKSSLIRVIDSPESHARAGDLGAEALPGLEAWAEVPYFRSYEGGHIRPSTEL